MIFALGIIVGIVICIFLIIIDIWLHNRGIGVSKGRATLEKKTRLKSQIIHPQSQRDMDTNKIIEENEKKGVATNLEDIL